MTNLSPHPTKSRDKMSMRIMFYLFINKCHIFTRFLNIYEEKNNLGHASNLMNNDLCFYLFKNDVFLFIFCIFKLMIHSFDYI